MHVPAVKTKQEVILVSLNRLVMGSVVVRLSLKSKINRVVTGGYLGYQFARRSLHCTRSEDRPAEEKECRG